MDREHESLQANQQLEHEAEQLEGVLAGNKKEMGRNENIQVLAGLEKQQEAEAEDMELEEDQCSLYLRIKECVLSKTASQQTTKSKLDRVYQCKRDQLNQLLATQEALITREHKLARRSRRLWKSCKSSTTGTRQRARRAAMAKEFADVINAQDRIDAHTVGAGEAEWEALKALRLKPKRRQEEVGGEAGLQKTDLPLCRLRALRRRCWRV